MIECDIYGCLGFDWRQKWHIAKSSLSKTTYRLRWFRWSNLPIFKRKRKRQQSKMYEVNNYYFIANWNLLRNNSKTSLDIVMIKLNEFYVLNAIIEIAIYLSTFSDVKFSHDMLLSLFRNWNLRTNSIIFRENRFS